MIKTHNITGLKYLCQTKRKNPFKYTGSGKYWKQHLAKHGENISTEIIGVYETKDQLKDAGCHYSDLYNIVESTEWANLRIEDGNGGDSSKTDGYIQGMKDRRSYSGEGNPNFGKIGYWNEKPGSVKNMHWFNNGEKEIFSLEAPIGFSEGRLLVKCPHCEVKLDIVNIKNWHFDYCKHNPNKLIKKSHLAGKYWWNNGTDHKKSKESPGEGWIKGRLDMTGKNNPMNKRKVTNAKE